MLDLVQWALRHGVSHAALADLRHMMGMGFDSPQPEVIGGGSEAAVTSRVRLEAPTKGVILWRNNLGAYQDEHGNFIRYGLANESAAMNKKIKSSDYIGLRRKLITLADVGHIIGQGVAREIKAEGWRYNEHDPHHAAQAKFGEIFASYGGDFAFATGVGSL